MSQIEIFVSLILDFIRAQKYSTQVPIVPLVTNSTSASASIVVREIVGCVFPKRLIGAELRVDRLPIGSRSIELAAGVDRKMRAP